MIYNLSNTFSVPGKMSEFSEIIAKELLPVYPKVGTKLVASFHAYTGNMNETYQLFVFDDFAAFQKAREAQQKDKGYRNAVAKTNALRISQTFTLLEPNAWSPMK